MGVVCLISGVSGTFAGPTKVADTRLAFILGGAMIVFSVWHWWRRRWP
jgi:hypothetical protein